MVVLKRAGKFREPDVQRSEFIGLTQNNFTFLPTSVHLTTVLSFSSSRLHDVTVFASSRNAVKLPRC